MARREFHFIEGSSNKFWAIALNGNSFSVNWGRTGTPGQAQTKEFASAGEAKKQYDKLVSEKVKKGYMETGGSGGGEKAAVPGMPAASKAPIATAPAKKPAAEEIPPVAQSPKAPPAQATAPAITISLDIERSIDLAPGDWAVAAWRSRHALPRPEVKPFDLQACVAGVARVTTNTYGWTWEWSRADIPPVMSPEEAHFWLAAMTQAEKKISPKELAAKLASQQFKKIGGDEAFSMVAKKLTSLTPEVLLPLASVLPIERLLEALAEPVVRGHGWSYASMPWNADPAMVLGFEQYVLPYLTDAEIATVREFVTPRIKPGQWPPEMYDRPSAAFFIAAMVKLSDPLLPVVQSWKNDMYTDSSWDHTHYHQPQVLVEGLGNAQVVAAEMRRLKLPLNKPRYVRGWLATTEYAALDYLRDSILAITKREDCEELLAEFARVKAPEAAPHMLQLKLTSKAPKVAREWLDAHVGCAIAGLIPVAAGRGALADAAIEHLRALRRAGHGELLRQAVGPAAPERLRKEVLDHVDKSYVAFDAESTPGWLIEAMAGAPKAKLPAWLPAHALPVLAVGDNRLSDEQVLAVLGALQKSTLDSPGPLLTAIRQNASPESRDGFAWRLFEAWLAEGAPSKEKWAMAAIGHLGADACVLKLTPMVRNWPGESQHQRAVFGLECLRAIGSDTALMQLNGVAQKLKFKGLKTKAMEYMDAIATQRHMSRTELEDRIVPDLDLDEKGTRIFDFGPRQFRFVLSPDMKAMLKDADGKVKSDLPSPGAKDDPAKSEQAVEQWKLLKKQIREVAKIQAERLEQAMVTGRRWTAAEFESLLVRHPLMINFVRLLVWGGYDAAGTLTTTFRVTEDQTCADEHDEETKLAGIARVGIVHPLHLSDTRKQAWGEILGDYEIVPPFDQLGRALHGLEKDEAQATKLARWSGIEIPATALVGTLDRLAWVRGQPLDGGVFHEHSKSFPGADVTAVVDYEIGVPIGYMEGWEDQKITGCRFIAGIYKSDAYEWNAESLKLGEVDPVAVSEVIKDLTLLASKGK